jgi:hypothetical protein
MTVFAASALQKEVYFGLCCHDRIVTVSVIHYFLFWYSKCHSQVFSMSPASFPPWTSAHIHIKRCHGSFFSTALCINKFHIRYPIQIFNNRNNNNASIVCIFLWKNWNCFSFFKIFLFNFVINISQGPCFFGVSYSVTRKYNKETYCDV